jgi:hypothetical protein
VVVLFTFLPSFLNCLLTYLQLTLAPSFVPRDHGVISPRPKNVIASAVYGTRAQSRANQIQMMPIGVPKVAYRVPGSQQADW